MDTIDIAIVGAGVIGLSVAAHVAQKGRSVFILEKNSFFGAETSSRNSEVIHAGIYYPQNTLKTRFCVLGNKLLYDFCKKEGIAYKAIGKLIVATTPHECDHLTMLLAHGRDNGVPDLRLMNEGELHEYEPSVNGVQALYSPTTGILDSHRFMERLLLHAHKKDADIVYESEVMGIEKKREGYHIRIREGARSESTVHARIVINCAGLDADTVAARAGFDCVHCGYILHYCKGEYFRLVPEKAAQIRHLLYPVPDPVSLGVHLTPDLAGGVRIGPNATYINRETAHYTVDEGRKDAFLAAAQKLIPQVTRADLFPDTAGIRPKLQGPDDPVKDFIICHESERGYPYFFNLIGIESPGLTAALAIGEYVSAMIENVYESL